MISSWYESAGRLARTTAASPPAGCPSGCPAGSSSCLLLFRRGCPTLCGFQRVGNRLRTNRKVLREARPSPFVANHAFAFDFYLDQQGIEVAVGSSRYDLQA